MPRVVRYVRALIPSVAIGSSLTAQMSSGSSGGGHALSPRVEMHYSNMYRDSAGQTANWMSYVVLWRGQPGWANSSRDPAARSEARRLVKEAQLAAIAADRGFFGGGGAVPFWGEIDHRSSRLYLLGQAYPIPPRDSALVVMIDRIDGVGGPPAVVAAAVIDGRLPASVRDKTWTSGDTIFTVRAARSAEEFFIGMLKQDPVIAAFIGESSSSPPPSPR